MSKPEKQPGDYVAYCDANGRIAFGQSVPSGQLMIASGPREKLVEMVSGAARHAYDGETLLVPGVPEAESLTDGLEALLRFRDRIRAYFERNGLKA